MYTQVVHTTWLSLQVSYDMFPPLTDNYHVIFFAQWKCKYLRELECVTLKATFCLEIFLLRVCTVEVQISQGRGICYTYITKLSLNSSLDTLYMVLVKIPLKLGLPDLFQHVSGLSPSHTNYQQLPLSSLPCGLG